MLWDKPEQPDWPTQMVRRTADGRFLGVDRSVWLYRSVPLQPVVDAADRSSMLSAATPILAAFEELAAMTPVRMARRVSSKQNYRQVHMLLVNVPLPYRMPGHPLQEYLEGGFAGTSVMRRVLLFGVRLLDTVTGAGWRHAYDLVVDTLTSGAPPLSTFDADFASLDAALTRSGFVTPSADDVHLADSWWNFGDHADTPVLPHPDHLHVFRTVDSARAAKNAGAENCAMWPSLTDHHALTAASVENLELEFPSATSRTAHWVHDILTQGAACVSIRGLVEPTTVTRTELRRRRKQYLDDVNERAQAGKMDRSEQSEKLAQLTDVEAAYSTPGSGVPTLIEASTIAMFNGRIDNVSDRLRNSAAKLVPMTNRQRQALSETMLCSPVRANPHLHDIPTHTIAFSALPSLAVAGDRTGAQLGLTERDRQPVLINPSEASDDDKVPIFLAAGQSGGGKTVTMLWLADQLARIRNARGELTPVIIVDPKMGSDHTEAVEASNGQVVSLDEATAADGAYDPVRFASRIEVGIELAASMLMSINPWGPRASEYERPLYKALTYGVRAGATCTGEALKIALKDGQAPKDMVDAVVELAESSPTFSGCVGVYPTTTALSLAQGITLIKVGDNYLDIGDPKEDRTQPPGLNQRIARALVRMMVYGSAMALTGRQGVVMLDEGWVFLSAGLTEVERLGRLARSQQVLPMIWTQRVTDALNAGLAGAISRGLILPFQDEEEAKAACKLFKLEPTQDRLDRILAEDRIGDAPNWSSMRALRDRTTGEVLRGAVGLYCDMAKRRVPVEIAIPPEFFRRASTNAEDIRQRQTRRASANPAAAAGQLATPAAALRSAS